MTERGRLALALGGATYLAAWAFGSKPLYPVATGLLLAVLVSWAWVHLAKKPMQLRRYAGEGEHVEGEDVPVALELAPDGRLVPGSALLVERISKLGERETTLLRDGRRLFGRYELLALPRGRYSFEDAHIVLEDAFGLERAELPVAAPGAVVVYPRLVEVDQLFSESGSRNMGGRRVLLRRPTGYDLHSVREYEQGESLRKVHWRTTARRGRLMVKELEDAPRDEVAVLLDADASSVVGTAPDSSFELQVRAAGSILRSHVLRGRRAVLLVNGQERETQRVASSDGDWRAALEVLAGVEPAANASLARLLAEEANPAARALELTVVTARLEPALVDRLVQRAIARQGVTLVYVDAASFNGAGARLEPGLLRLHAAGIPVAVLRRGDDLAAKLSAAPPVGAVGG